jgi:hypothetical protein
MNDRPGDKKDDVFSLVVADDSARTVFIIPEPVLNPLAGLRLLSCDGPLRGPPSLKSTVPQGIVTSLDRLKKLPQAVVEN